MGPLCNSCLSHGTDSTILTKWSKGWPLCVKTEFKMLYRIFSCSNPYFNVGVLWRFDFLRVKVVPLIPLENKSHVRIICTMSTIDISGSTCFKKSLKKKCRVAISTLREKRKICRLETNNKKLTGSFSWLSSVLLMRFPMTNFPRLRDHCYNLRFVNLWHWQSNWEI